MKIQSIQLINECCQDTMSAVSYFQVNKLVGCSVSFYTIFIKLEWLKKGLKQTKKN